MSYLPPKDPFVLLENTRDPDGLSFLFEKPARIIICDDADHVAEALKAVEDGVADGLHAAGWISYEVGYAFEERLRPLMPEKNPEPLVWMGLFPTRQVLTRADLEDWWLDTCQGRSGALSPLVPDLDQAAYVAAVQKVKAYLAAGDVYQANLTMAAHANVSGDPLALHRALSQAQPVSFAAFIAAGDWCVSSHSPELFFARRQDRIEVKPMKGTAARGRSTREDDEAALALQADAKSRAENLMIVDLERNDLSRIAQPGSVSVSDLFEVSHYPTLLQLTSRVQARLAEKQGFADIIHAMFPCGSVTGAPKIRAMEIIRALENNPRGVYTGAIGHVAPDGDMTFNVPIRTLVIDSEGAARFGLGSGIVADSDPVAEYEECLLKGAFLADPKPSPSLIETILWDRHGVYWLLEEHLERLALSARYFGYPFNADGIDAMLTLSAEAFDTDTDQRVRLLLSPTGDVSVSALPLDVLASRAQWQSKPPSAALCHDPVASSDHFLFHKTTRRERYNSALREAVANGHWDVLFFNERGEVTEGARSNIFVEIEGQLYTPPVECGLLPGVFRAHLLSQATDSVREKVLVLADLQAADKVFFGNALYGLVPIECQFSEIKIP